MESLGASVSFSLYPHIPALPPPRHARPAPPRPLRGPCARPPPGPGRPPGAPAVLDRDTKGRRKTTDDVRRSPSHEKGRGRNPEEVHRSGLPLHPCKPPIPPSLPPAPLLNTDDHSPCGTSSSPTTPTSTKAAPSRNSPSLSVVKAAAATPPARSSPVTVVVDTSGGSVSSTSIVALLASTMSSGSSMTLGDQPTSPSSRSGVRLLP